jgi:hypothetical protein
VAGTDEVWRLTAPLDGTLYPPPLFAPSTRFVHSPSCLASVHPLSQLAVSWLLLQHPWIRSPRDFLPRLCFNIHAGDFFSWENFCETSLETLLLDRNVSFAFLCAVFHGGDAIKFATCHPVRASPNTKRCIFA